MSDNTLVKNIPNTITFFRIILFPALIYLVFREERFLFSWIFFSALLSDILDGLLARMLKVQSSFGAKVDSIADLLTFVSGIYGILIFEPSFVSNYFPWITTVLGLYFAEMIYSLIKFSSISSFHTYASRVAAYALGILFMTLFWFGVWSPFLYLSFFLCCFAYMEEIAILFYLKELKPNVRGMYWIWKQNKNVLQS
ncbi:CDP-alcohol phosphatidyltransferase family protein [Leptospira sp. 201903070]|jgi:phosphatidylglycerophosphate synthase|uniref:CDP-alcohol phosphatidyltransferase family protein n=1 Tax=Leptospira ainlahdjerensis TaxID=2810033 RepID=A0ABS2U649_9LEPT|nr:CDP-alcohol phosphatidyltransferase family protein [Leptospira ainlahdjerensis]MBM9575845.1 CDP-alcohol phosphatidyltransferase family protein [Leptospira ainlahdjerensis]